MRERTLWPWQQDDAARFADVAWFHHGFSQVGPQTLCDPGRTDQTDCENILFRTSRANALQRGSSTWMWERTSRSITRCRTGLESRAV